MFRDWKVGPASLLEGPLRVLVVEPSREERSRAVAAFSAAGMAVSEADGIVSAEAAWSSGGSRPDLVWARWDDGDDDGFSSLGESGQGPDQGQGLGLKIVGRVKADPSLRFVPVILYGRSATEAERVAAFSSGAADFLAPPWEGPALTARALAAARDGRALALLEHRAYRDALTGLLNRGAVADLLVRTGALCQRRGAPLSFLLVDLDRLKSINDEHGHAQGDAAIVRVATALKRCVRAGDLAARLGGDEFLAVAVDCPPDRAPALGWRIQKEVAAGHSDPLAFPISISVGAAGALDVSAADLDEVLDRADRALALAKRSGRASVAEFRDDQNGPMLVREP